MKNRLNSLGTLMVCVLIAALGCAAATAPSYPLFTMLLYVKLGSLLWAALKARFGPSESADWWFGFAAFGLMHLTFSSYTYHRVYFDLWIRSNPYGYARCLDVALWLGMRIGLSLGLEPTGLTEVLNTWTTLAFGAAGGSVSVVAAKRARTRRGHRDDAGTDGLNESSG